MKIYSQIDQEGLEKLGLAHKSEFDNEGGSLKSIHKLSLL